MEQYQDERRNLDKTLKELKRAYKRLNKSIEGSDQQYNDLKQYMVDYKNEMDKMEIFSNQQALYNIDKIGVTKLNERAKLEKLIDSPYFGRIDFIFEGDTQEDAETFYIGPFGFTSEDMEQMIYDWRAPVSNMYYEFELGKAFYMTMDNQFKGEIIRKRQYKISKSDFDYILENSLTIQDDVLQKTLSENSTEKMKTIITTIQKEQNQIVRNEHATTFVIQGVAGSGKTSIALHRIAYLLYKYRETLQSENILILSPNKVFSNYISTVLPELGEEPIREITIDQLTGRLLPTKYKVTSFHTQLKKIMDEPDCEFAKRVAFKSSLQFFNQLEQYLQQLNKSILVNQSIVIADYEIDSSYISSRFEHYSKEPVMKRLELLAEDLMAVIKNKRQGEVKVPSKNEIVKRLEKRLCYKDPLDIYKAFLSSINQEDQFVFQKKTFEFADVYPYLYCRAYFEGIEKFDFIEHLVIDEMQDYSPVQFAVLQKLFSCNKTILGDFGQSLNPFAVGVANELIKIFPQVEYVELKKSYRSSYEIIEYAKKFIGQDAIEAIERHGKEPSEIFYESNEELQTELLMKIEEFNESRYKTCGIICKSEEQAQLIRTMLANQHFHVINEQTNEFQDGISISTIQFAKGLEFDQVIIPFIDKKTYHQPFDKGLLYIACTRAMHDLSLLFDKKQPSPLIQKLESTL